MTEKAALIARKHDVIAQIERLRRQLASEEQRASSANKKRRAQLQHQLERLMAEEYRLRLQIDRSR